ncbi:aminotransferase class V-fold PLP-dependent enzyme [Stieleria varia]|nr:aminotransferase class V-fold PLP-dependent enzyme [Stieleria varia]
MPIVRQWAYLDHAAVGPLPGPTADAIRHFAMQAECLGDTVWPQWSRKLDLLRSSFADLISAEPSEICLVPNTTTGINIVAEGWPWQPGDSVVLPEGEFPSNLFPWQNQASRGVELRIIPRRDGRVEVADLLDHVDDSTRMIAVSWVGYASGYRVDLHELVQQAHRRGVLVFLDAIQGLGMYPLDCRQTPVDFLAADGHKWMLGPEGIGVAMIRQEHLNTLRCGNVGWNSVQASFNYAQPELKLRNSATRFEAGSSNMLGASALSASVDLIGAVNQAHGPQAIEKRLVELATQFHHQLSDLGIDSRMPSDPQHRSGIVTFEVPWAEPNAVRNAALEKNCVVSCRDGGVRASIHAYNDASDLQRLIDVVASLKP